MARPSTVTSDLYNEVSTAYFTAVNEILTGQAADAAARVEQLAEPARGDRFAAIERTVAGHCGRRRETDPAGVAYQMEATWTPRVEVAPLARACPTVDQAETRGGSRQEPASASPGSSSCPVCSSSRSSPSIRCSQTFRLSFTNTRLASPREPRDVGFDNYVSLLARRRLSLVALCTPSSSPSSSVGLGDASGAGDRPGHPFQLPGPRRRAHLHARALGDPDRRFRGRCGSGCITMFSAL